MNKTTIVFPTPTLEIDPFNVQIGIVMLFFAGCILIIALLAFCLFGSSLMNGITWLCSASCLRCCLKCCCPTCCKKAYRKLITKAENLMYSNNISDSDDDASIEMT